MRVLLLDDNLDLENDLLRNKLLQTYPEINILNITKEDDLESLTDISFWNTLLIYRFSDVEISSWQQNFIKKYLSTTDNKGSVFPVSYGEENKPPDIIAHLKANSISAENSLEIISNRVGAFLGLSCIGKDHTLFISYREKDGKDFAIKIEEILKSRGFRTWRDEAKDSDKEGALILGQDAQETIEKNLNTCTAIVLIDTPSVTESEWVLKEIEMANSRLIPILPLCFRKTGDLNKGPRFRTLRNLQRWLDIDDCLINEEEIVNYLEKFLLDIYKRKRELPLQLERSFKKKGYSWLVLEAGKLYFSSSKAIVKIVKNILSHCPIHNGLYPPYIDQFSRYTPNDQTHYNFRILIYDGEIIPPSEIAYIINGAGASNVQIFHHQDIELILEEL